MRHVGPSARVTGRGASQLSGDGLDERPGAVQREASMFASRGRLQTLEDPSLGLHADSRNLAQPSGGDRLPELFEVADPERPCDLEHPLRCDTQQATEADELDAHVLLELSKLGDIARLDQLLQPAGDPRPDAPELLYDAFPDELLHGHRRRADGLRGAAVRARRVAVGAHELEEERKRVQALGDLRVLHGSTHTTPAPAERPARPWPPPAMRFRGPAGR